MRVNGLVDTGAILALLNPLDRWHRPCCDAFEALLLPLATTAAVLAELFHLLSGSPRNLEACWRLLRSGAITVLPISDADLPEIERLMLKYSDRPMDFADASLVLLAQREALVTVFTIDHDDFETYRIRGRQKFRISPPR